METEQAKIYHHHTPRQYLLPWADADERIAWYGYGKVDRSGLTVVGGENDFYKLKELTVQDIDCIKLFIDGLSEVGRKGHKRFWKSISCLHGSRGIWKSGASKNPTAMKLLDLVISNLNENYHAAIEKDFWPYLEAIKNRDFSFYEDPIAASGFFYGLYVQYMRTKAVKVRARQKVNVLFEDIERVWDVRIEPHPCHRSGQTVLFRS